MTDTVIPDAVVWPEDDGTNPSGAVENDWGSAGHFGTLGTALGTDYVRPDGWSVQYNPSMQTLDIPAGLFFVSYAGQSTVQQNSRTYDYPWNEEMVFLVSTSAVSNLQLSTGTTNEVWVAVDLETENGAFYRHGSGQTTPAEPVLHLATIDTTTNEITQHVDTEPDLTASHLTAETVSTTDLQTQTGTVAGSEMLTTADEGHENGLDADTVDSYHKDEFAANRRTFPIEVTSATDDRIKIGTISDGGPDEAGKCTVTIISPVGTETNYSSTLKMNVGVDDSQYGISHYYYGISAATEANNVGLVVTETAGTGTNGNNEYHLYVNPANSTDCLVVVEYTKFGTFDYLEGLTTADYQGTPVYETIPEAPSMDVGFGEVDTERISGGVTGGVDLSSFTGENLSIENGALTATDTRVDVTDNGTAFSSDTTTIDFTNALNVSGTAPNATVAVEESQIDHGNLAGITASDHHTRYSDTEAVSAIESQTGALSIDISGDANTLDNADSSAYALLAQNETVTGTWTFNNQQQFNGGIESNGQLHVLPAADVPDVHIEGGPDVDAEVLTVDGDGDAGQHDDIIKARANSAGSGYTNADTKFVVKGEGLVGINTYNPNAPLHVNGNAIIRGNDVVVGTNQWEIRKNGADGAGVINFRT